MAWNEVGAENERARRAQRECNTCITHGPLFGIPSRDDIYNLWRTYGRGPIKAKAGYLAYFWQALPRRLAMIDI